MAETAAAPASAAVPAAAGDLGELPVVVALGPVDPGLVSGVFAGHCRFVAEPAPADLAAAARAVVRAEAQVDAGLLDRAPCLRVIARTGVGVDRVDVAAATARGVAVVITPGAGAAAVALWTSSYFVATAGGATLEVSNRYAENQRNV